MDELTEQQRIFCEEYLIDYNATRACLSAGYAKSGARTQGYRLLTRDYIQNYLQKREKETLAKLQISKERIVAEIASIAFDDISNYLTFKTNNDGEVKIAVKDSTKIDTKNVSEISIGSNGQVKLKMYARDTALYRLADMLGIGKESDKQNNENDIANAIGELIAQVKQGDKDEIHS